MRTKLIIIGAGNVGGFLTYNLEDFGSYELIGFLDDDQAKHGQYCYGQPVLGGIDQLKNYQPREICLAIGISSPKAKSTMVARLNSYSFEFPAFISRHAWLSKKVEVGKGVILYPGVSVNYECNVHDFVIMNMNCAIGHNCTIGAYSSLAPGVNLAGFTTLEEGVTVGIGVSTKQNVRVGKFASIGGQSMLTKNIPPNSVVMGVPGKCK